MLYRHIQEIETLKQMTFVLCVIHWTTETSRSQYCVLFGNVFINCSLHKSIVLVLRRDEVLVTSDNHIRSRFLEVRLLHWRLGYLTVPGLSGILRLACVASVSVWFRSKEIPRKGTFGIDRARNETRAKKWKRATFLAVFGSRSSFFSPKPHRNVCYTGYSTVIWIDYNLGRSSSKSCLKIVFLEF